MNIPRTRAERIALRDRLNELIEAPGADKAPFMCRTGDGDFLRVRNSRSCHHGQIVELRRNGRQDRCVILTPDSARRLAARLLWLCDNPEEW